MKRGWFLLLALPALGAARADSLNPLDVLRLEDLSATRERPLFASTRRPPPPARVEAAPIPAVAEEKVEAVGPPPFELIGAVVGRRDSIALLRNTATSEVFRLRPGERADGWRVDAVSLRSVALERDGRQQTLALSGPPPAAAGPQVAGEAQPAEAAAAAPPPDPRGLSRKMRDER